MISTPVYLDRNENNYGPAPACLDVIQKVHPRELYGYSKAYQRGVKSVLSERLASHFSVPEKRILLGYGAEDILKQVVQCYLTPGSKLMVPAFSWWYYKEIANEVRGENVEYPLTKGPDSFYYDVDAMIDLIENEDPMLVFISSPNNPTGNSIDSGDLDTILARLQDKIVVMDEAYWYHDDNVHITELIRKYENIVVIRTFSKYYALAGIRIGFALIGERLDLLAKLSNRYLGYNTLSEKIAIAALDSPDYYREISQKMNADKEVYYEELSRIPGFTVFRSDANFILVEIPPDIKGELKSYLDHRGLIIKFMNEPVLHSHLRITIGTQEENRALIDAITSFMDGRS